MELQNSVTGRQKRNCVFRPKSPFISEMMRQESIDNVDQYIINRKLQVTDMSVSLSTTLSDLKRWDVDRAPMFGGSPHLCTYARIPYCQQRSNSPCHPTWGGVRHVLRSHTPPQLKRHGARTSAPIFWTRNIRPRGMTESNQILLGDQTW